MKNAFIIITVITGIITLFFCNAMGQSLKGKTWQSQDTLDINDPPATLVFNENSTYSLIRFAYYNRETIFPYGVVEEGEYTVTSNSLTLTRIIGSSAVSQEVYKFKWKNNLEFTLSIGINSFTFALLSSDKDSFTPKFIVPYLKGAIAKNDIIQPCFGDLVQKIKAKSENIAVKKESSSEPLKSFSLKGKFWQSESDSPFFGFGTLIIFHEDNTYDQVIFLPPKYSMKLNENGTYSKEEIQSDKESGVSISLNRTFQGKFMESSNYLALTQKNFSQNNAPKPYKIEWISEKEFKMSMDNRAVKFIEFCSEGDLFTPKYTIPLIEKQVKAGVEVMPFLNH